MRPLSPKFAGEMLVASQSSWKDNLGYLNVGTWDYDASLDWKYSGEDGYEMWRKLGGSYGDVMPAALQSKATVNHGLGVKHVWWNAKPRAHRWQQRVSSRGVRLLKVDDLIWKLAFRLVHSTSTAAIDKPITT